MEHPDFILPNTPHAEYRYKMAMKHVLAAQASGKSLAEQHAIFQAVMNYNLEALPLDEAHQAYQHAVVAAKQALVEGKSEQEVHKIFTDTLNKAQ